MPAPSLAHLALEQVEDMRTLLEPGPTPDLPLSPAARSALLLALAKLEDAARRRIGWSEREALRRKGNGVAETPVPRSPVD